MSTIDLYLAIKHIYPELEDDKDFILKNDGEDTYILKWNSELPQPTEVELNSVWIDVQLSTTKQMKIVELNEECNKTILGRFSHDINGESFLFSCDLEAQSNFDKCDRAFEKGYMTEIAWTAYNSAGEVVRVDLTAETFPALYMAHLNHIQGNISKFRDTLMPLVENATTIEEVEGINW